MKILIKPHARKRMRERLISKKLINSAIASPTKVLYDENGRILFKKLYKNKGIDRLVLIAGERKNTVLEIITVIEISKIKKYL